ncbi:hypothetical protein [Bacillus nitroreducens]
MNTKFKDLPKSVQKVIRFIYQDASYEQLHELEHHIERAIKIRLSELDNKKRKSAG